MASVSSPPDLDNPQTVAKMAANLLRMVIEDRALWEQLCAKVGPPMTGAAGRLVSLHLAERLAAIAEANPRPALDALEAVALQGAATILRRLASEEEMADKIASDHPALSEDFRLIASLDLEPAGLRQLADQVEGIRRRLKG